MIPLDRVRALLSLAPGPHGGTLMDTSMVHDLARDVLTLADALATADASIVQLRADLECADHERQRVESERDAMEEQRDTARSALDGLVAAVRAEREAERGHAAVRADDASRGRHLRAAEAAVDKARHATDASSPPRPRGRRSTRRWCVRTCARMHAPRRARTPTLRRSLPLAPPSTPRSRGARERRHRPATADRRGVAPGSPRR